MATNKILASFLVSFVTLAIVHSTDLGIEDGNLRYPLNDGYSLPNYPTANYASNLGGYGGAPYNNLYLNPVLSSLYGGYNSNYGLGTSYGNGNNYGDAGYQSPAYPSAVPNYASAGLSYNNLAAPYPLLGAGIPYAGSAYPSAGPYDGYGGASYGAANNHQTAGSYGSGANYAAAGVGVYGLPTNPVLGADALKYDPSPLKYNQQYNPEYNSGNYGQKTPIYVPTPCNELGSAVNGSFCCSRANGRIDDSGIKKCCLVTGSSCSAAPDKCCENQVCKAIGNPAAGVYVCADKYTPYNDNGYNANGYNANGYNSNPYA